MKYIMRSLYQNIITSVALVVSALTFGSVALAQAPVVYDKYVTGPNEDGVFTINLEAYAPGSVSVEKNPFDVILVLDRSGSMRYNMAGEEYVRINNEWQRPYLGDQRISKIKEAVQKFVQYLKNNPPDQEDARGGHRIAVVWFSGQNSKDQNAVYTGTGLNEFQKVSQLETVEAEGSGDGYQQAQVLLGSTNLLLNVNPSGGTYSDKGMARAKSILNTENTTNAYTNTPKRQRLVVFFTDGEPGGYGWSGNDGTSTANGCLRAADDIKNSTAYGASIYSIGLFEESENPTRTTTYLSYTSSDYNDKRTMPTASNQYVNVSNNYSKVVTDAEELNNIFTSIADNISKAASGSSVLVDIVTADFSISAPVADGATVNVWAVPCTQSGPNADITFSDKYAADGTTLLWTNLTDSGILDQSKLAQGEISVTGYDYAENWCGWNSETGQVHGNKLLLEIPISVKDDIVGGPNMHTNLPGSGITVKNKAGEPIGTYYFPIPEVKVPVTIWIKKEGLLSSSKDPKVQGHEDNAVFTIRKTKFYGVYETNTAGEVFDGAKRIEYTYTKGSTKKFIVKGVETEIKWETFTKVSVNMKEGIKDGIVKISGLDADYVYRIEEDAWAHLGYDFDPNTTARYTLEWDETAGEYKEPTNPFTFSNTPKTTAFYSEDVVRNVFNPGSEKPTEPIEEPAQK